MEEHVVSESGKLFPNEIVFESKYFVVAQDWEIAIPGFFIVSPKRKLRSILDFSEEESVDYIDTLRKVRKGMLKVLGIKDVYYFQNEDTPYGFHLWMLPYCGWMADVANRGPGMLVPVWKHAKEKMSDKKNVDLTTDAAEKMRKYFSASEK